VSNMTRRELFASAIAPGAGKPAKLNGETVSGRELLRVRYFPNVTLTTHLGKKVKFYDDLIKDKILVINVMYATCEGFCPIITSKLVEVRKLLGSRVGKDIFFYSITVKPEEDSPRKLKEYVEMHNARGPGWFFLTGKPRDVELLRQKLGFVDGNPLVDKEDKTRHSGLLRYGNEPLAQWSSCQSGAKASWIAKSILFVDWPDKKQS